MKKLTLVIMTALLAVHSYADSVTLDTLTVTAQKYEQAENKTPISTSTFSDIDLDEKNITTLKDLSLYSAGVNVKADNVGNSTVIRGIAPLTATLSGPAGIFIDGVAMPTVFMQQPELYNIERVEILKGPQGSLYGRNTESGVINIISKKPGNSFSFSAGAEYFVYDTDDDPNGIKYRLSFDGPLVKDRLFAGFGFAGTDTDGYFTNSYNGDDKAGELERKDFSFRLLFTPSEKTEIYLSSYYFDSDDAKGKFRYITGPSVTPEYTINYNDSYSQDYSGSVNSLHLSHSFKNFELTSITGYTDYSRDFKKDFDGSAASRGLSVFDLDDNAFSEEIRFSSDKTKTKWVAGFYGFTQSTDAVFEKTGMQDRRDSAIKTTGAAVFGQISPRITDKLYADIGLRLEQTRVDADMDRTYMTNEYSYSDDESYFQALPKISLNYETETGIIYLSASKGYLSGGANYNLATSDETLIYDEEETLNYEAGFKSSFGGGRYSLNGALFYVDMNDKQVTQVVPGEMGSMKIDNAASAHSYGAEAEFEAMIIQGLKFFTSASYVKTEADDWTSSQFNAITMQEEYYDYSGNRLPSVPEYSFAAGLQYMHTTGLFAAGDMVSTGSYYHDGANNLKEDANTVFNIRAGYIGESVSLTLWCENLLDKSYYETQVQWGTLAAAEDAQPRTFGVRLDYRY